MDKQGITKLLGHVGVDVPKQQKRKGWVVAACPLAPWLHRGGRDKHPSFAVSDKPGEISRYNCFTCGSNGSLLDLVLSVRAHNQESQEVDANILKATELCATEGDEALGNIPDYDEVESIDKGTPIVPWPDTYLERFHPLGKQAWTYLNARGFKLADGEGTELLYHRKRKRIVFVMRDWIGKLTGCHTRTVIAGVKPSYLAYTYDYRKPDEELSQEGVCNWNIWLGEQYVDENDPVVIAEGPMDWFSIRRVYPNTICALSVGLSVEKIKRLRHLSSIVTVFDFGAGGDQARERMSKILPGKCVHLTPLEEYGDAGAMPASALRLMLEDYVPV